MKSFGTLLGLLLWCERERMMYVCMYVCVYVVGGGNFAFTLPRIFFFNGDVELVGFKIKPSGGNICEAFSFQRRVKQKHNECFLFL